MALMNPVLRRKATVQQQSMTRDALPQTSPTGPQPRPMAFGGSAPRQPGNVIPQAPGSLGATRIPGISGPRQPPSATAPATGSLPGAPARPAAPVNPVADYAGGAGKGMDPNAGQPPGTDDVDTMIREFLAGQLRGAGKANTAEEEALIRQQMADAAGGMSVNARARAGRSGMASSGALMGQEGDIRRAASQDALDQILGLRRTEEQRSIDNAMGAIGAETGMRSAAANDELRRMALAALQAEMGLDAGPGPTDVGNAPGGGTAITPADANKDGTVSAQEQQRYDQNVADPYMAGSQKASDYFNGGGDASSLPSQPPGGDVIVIRQPRVDVDGNERPGVTYNTKTGQIGRF